jgi:hypothetical protein
VEKTAHRPGAAQAIADFDVFEQIQRDKAVRYGFNREVVIGGGSGWTK